MKEVEVPSSSLAKEAARLVDVVRSRGFPVVMGGKHWKILDPHNPRRVVATIAATPSDRKFWLATVTELKKVGVLEHDPKKEGQVASGGRTRTVSDREKTVRAKVEEVLRAIPRGDFYKHVVEVADTLNGRKFASPKAAGWQINQMEKGPEGKHVPEWALNAIEAAADDLLKVTRPKVEEPKAAEETVEAVERHGVTRGLTPAPASTRGPLEQIARDIQRGLGLKARAGRSRRWGYGVWQIVGRLALETAKRRNIDPRFTPRKGKESITIEHALGNRMRDVIEGKSVWAVNKEIAAGLVEDWKRGHRLTPEIISAVRLRDGVEIPPELRSTATPTPTPTPTVEEVPAPEETPVATWHPTPEGEPTRIGDTEEFTSLRQRFAEAMDRTEELRAPSIPEQWTTGETPLHLRTVAHTLMAAGVNEEVVGAVIDTAYEVMLTELRSMGYK